jgi:hypothetical protein
MKLKKIKKKYYLYIKNIDKVLKVKNVSSFAKLEKIKKEMPSNSYNDIEIKEYTPEINTKYENPVVTQEKERERALHQTILFGRIFKFSINNYYDLNVLLRDLTLHQLYYQQFIDLNLIKKQLVEEKRVDFFINCLDNITIKDELNLFNDILKKIEKNKNLLNSNLIESSYKSNNEKDNFLLEKLLDYIIVNKKDNFFIKKFLTIFDIDESLKKNLQKKGKLSMKKTVEEIKLDLQIERKLNKFNLLDESIFKIRNNEKLVEIKYKYNYIERNKIENIDNQYLLNTVKKYNEGNKINLKNEFNEIYVSKNNKNN